MIDILSKTGNLIILIVFGFLFRYFGVIKKEDSKTILNLYMNVTLPAAVIASFRGYERNMSLIFVAVIAVLMNGIMSLTGFLAGWKGGKKEQAFGIINYSGYNVGAFAMPFLQNFVGTSGILVASIFDAGNALMCSGMSFVLASSVLEGKAGGFREIPGKLFRIIPFDVYVSMLVLYILNIHLPDSVYRVAGLVADANTFLAMFAIGASIKWNPGTSRLWLIIKNLLLRYGMSVFLAVVIYVMLPFNLLIRQILVIIAFAPVSSITVVNTSKCGLDEERAGIVNSATILISLCMMMAAAGALGL